jgi:small subunit ribosomal protein S6
MTCYETLFVVKPTLTDEETTAQIEKIQDIVTKNGGELLATDKMGMRRLAYPVEKNERGYYAVLFYKAEGTLIQELERLLKINEDVIKFLTVKYTKQKELAQFNKLVESASKKSEPVEQKSTPEAEETQA